MRLKRKNLVQVTLKISFKQRVLLLVERPLFYLGKVWSDGLVPQDRRNHIQFDVVSVERFHLLLLRKFSKHIL